MNDEEKLRSLNQVLERCKKSSFYCRRLPEKALDKLDDLKRIPLLTKADIRDNSPFGLVCVPGKELYLYHETFGTTGKTSSTWLTVKDVKDLNRRVNLRGIDFNENDMVLIRFPYAISSVAHFTHAAAQDKNACVIPAGSRTVITPFPRVLDLMRKLKVTVLAALPLQALLIAETAEMLGYNPREDFPDLRVVYTAGEVMTSNRRRVLEQIWGVPVIDNYGMTETGPMATDCRYGCLHPIDDSYIFELLDDDLKEEVSPGEVGNLVITSLTRYALPLVRYLPGDRARKYRKSCPCGEEMAMQVKGRMQDTLMINGKLLDIWDMDDIVSHLPCGRFWAAGPLDGKLKIVVEKEKAEDSVESGIVDRLEEKYGVGLIVELVPKGTLYDRGELLAIGMAGKPKYIFNEEEMKSQTYVKSARV